MTDDIDLTWDFSLTPRRFDDDLHSPYVRGTRATLFAHSSDRGEDLRNWSIESSDPAVFAIGPSALVASDNDLVVAGHAVGEGTALLTLRDPHGNAVGRGVAEVLLPDGVELASHGSLILGREDEAPVHEVRVLVGGEATYLVKYFRGGRELHGNGVLAAVPPAGVDARPRTSFVFENREWLSIDATTVGNGAMDLLADGVAVKTVPTVVVPETAIADVIVLAESESGHHDGDWLAALAQAYDANGERIFGVDYAWNVDGATQAGDGDLYRYQFKAGQYSMVRAQRGTHSDSTRIQSDGGYVGSTNQVGCSAGGGSGLAWGALLALGFVVARRRARAS